MTAAVIQDIDDCADFTGLGDVLSPAPPAYSTRTRVRPQQGVLVRGVVTSIGPDMLPLDEGIGAVDTAFPERVWGRLSGLVRRRGGPYECGGWPA